MAKAGKISESTARRLAEVTRRVLGSPATSQRAPALSDGVSLPPGLVLAKALEGIAAGGSGPIEICTGTTKGSEEGSGIESTGFSRWSAVAEDDFCLAAPLGAEGYEVFVPGGAGSSEATIVKLDVEIGPLASGQATVMTLTVSPTIALTATTQKISVVNFRSNYASKNGIFLLQRVNGIPVIDNQTTWLP